MIGRRYRSTTGDGESNLEPVGGESVTRTHDRRVIRDDDCKPSLRRYYGSAGVIGVIFALVCWFKLEILPPFKADEAARLESKKSDSPPAHSIPAVTRARHRHVARPRASARRDAHAPLPKAHATPLPTSTLAVRRRRSRRAPRYVPPFAAGDPTPSRPRPTLLPLARNVKSTILTYIPVDALDDSFDNILNRTHLNGTWENLTDHKPGWRGMWTSSEWRRFIKPEYFVNHAEHLWSYKPLLSETLACIPPGWIQTRPMIWLDFDQDGGDGWFRPHDLEELGWTRPFAAARTTYSPSYLTCSRATAFKGGTRIVFFPAINSGTEHDCDMLPILMRNFAPNSNETGVAVDVGASEGMCTLLLLSHGHRVYSYEPNRLFQEWRAMSVRANPGFSDRVNLRGGLDLKTTLDRELLFGKSAPPKIALLKIDADNYETSIIYGARKLLNSGKVTLVQLELLAEAGSSLDCDLLTQTFCPITSQAQKERVLWQLADFGYDIYVVLTPGNRGYPEVFMADSKLRSCREMWDGRTHFENGRTYGTQYQYGDGHIDRLVLIPIDVRDSGSKLVACHTQFLGVWHDAEKQIRSSDTVQIMPKLPEMTSKEINLFLTSGTHELVDAPKRGRR